MKSKIRFSIFLFFLSIVVCSYAQNEIEDITEYAGLPVKGSNFIYFDVLAIINPSMGIQVGYEHNIWNNLNLVAEATYQVPSWSNMRGYKLMLSPRHYLSNRFFMGLEVMYKNIHADRQSWFDLNTHFRRIEYTSRIETKVGALQIGFIDPLKSAKFMVFEFAASVGSGTREVTHEGTGGFRILEEPIFGLGWNVGKRNIPYFNLAAKFKFLLNKP